VPIIIFRLIRRDLPQRNPDLPSRPAAIGLCAFFVDHGGYHSQPEWSENILILWSKVAVRRVVATHSARAGLNSDEQRREATLVVTADVARRSSSCWNVRLEPCVPRRRPRL